MKKLFFSLSIMVAFAACNKKDCNCETGACNDTPPTEEACMAHFSRYFYNKESKSCELKSYSGCSEKGFATLEDCNKCLQWK
jgi:hypothetical protein